MYLQLKGQKRTLIIFCFFLDSADFKTTAYETLTLFKQRKTPVSKPKRKSWKKRMEVQDQKWKDHKEEILNCKLKTCFLSGSCQICNKASMIKCEECFKNLCAACDKDVHLELPLHNRSSFVNGFLEPLAPTQCLNFDGSKFSISIQLFNST